MTKGIPCAHNPKKRCDVCRLEIQRAQLNARRAADPLNSVKRKAYLDKDPEKWRNYRNSYAKTQRRTEPEKYLESRGMRFGGLKIKQLRAFQNDLCPGCFSDLSKKRDVDHVHDETKQVRGLTCRKCNLSIGLAGDDPARLRRLANYLENPPAKQLLEQAQEPVQLSFDFSLINPSPDRISNV